MTDFERARRSMIDSQIRPGGVIDLRVVAAMAEVPRELFVPEERRTFAYIDEDLFIGTDAEGAKRYLMEPLTFARMLQLADIAPEDCVLDVGTTTGYSAAVLSKLAQSVIALERDAALAEKAGTTLEELDCVNVAVVTGPHEEGWRREAPYDAIVLNGRIEERPDVLLEQLADLGRLVCVFGRPHESRIRVYTRRDKAISFIDYHDASVPPLPGFAATAEVMAF